MAANLYANGQLDGAYFGRQSAWHTMGKVGDLEPEQAYAELGISDERAEKLYRKDGTETSWSIITRTAADGTPVTVSDPVAQTWFWVSHAEAAAIAGRATGGHLVETMGVLGQKRGDIMFCTFPLRTVKITGDEHRQYVFFMNSLRYQTASVLGVTDVRMVCQNTVDLGLARAASIFKAGHREGVVAETLEWFQGVWGTAIERGDEIVVAAEHLATIRVDDKALAEALLTVIPYRAEPRPTGSPKRDRDNQRSWENWNVRTAQAHALVVDLFNGKGAGLDQPGLAGTAWGAWNAIGEWCDHFAPAASPAARAEHALVGDTVRIKTRAARVLASL